MAKQLNTNILDIVGSPTVTYDGIASFTINNGFTIKSSAYTDSLVIILKLYYQTFTETSGANTIIRESKTNSNTSVYIDTFNQYKVVWYNSEYGKVSDSDLEIYKFRPNTYCFLRITYTNSSILGEILKDNITATTTLEEALANSNWINLSWNKAVSNYFTDRLFQIGGSDLFGWGGTIDLSNSSINGQKLFVEQTTHYTTHIQLRRDTAANWTTVNPTLLEGEVGLETDTGKSKIGDGSTAWNSLAYDLASTALQSITSSNVTTALGYTPVDTNLSNLSATGKTVLDGQWVAADTRIASDVSVNGSTKLTYTLSDVPNDGNKYEVLLMGHVYTSNTSGNAARLTVSSDIINDVTICGAITRTSQSNIAMGSVVIPVGNREIKVSRDTGWNGTINLYIRGYRRIGSNN